MKEYLILVTQLEHLHRQGTLSLQKLWFYIQPTMRTMEILASIGKAVKTCGYSYKSSTWHFGCASGTNKLILTVAMKIYFEPKYLFHIY